MKRIKTLKQKNAPQKAIQPPKVDYQAILSKYDAQAIKNSPIKYFTAAKSLVNDLLNILQQQEIAQAEKISEISRIGLNLNNKFTFSPQLTPEENELLSERQNFLAEMLSVGTDEAKTRLLSVKTQAENFLSSLDKIYYSENYFNELADFENARRPSFSFLIEHLSLVVKDVMAKLEFLAANKDFIIKIAKLQAAWNDNYKAFKMNLREELTLSCSEAGIDAEIYQKWYEDWRMKRFAIEKSFLPLIEFAFKGHFDFIEDVLKILREYISFIDAFYLHERKNIYRKFVFEVGGDLQEKFETESIIYKATEKFQRDLQRIIFSRDAAEERIYLLRWSEPILNLPIEEISKFIAEKEIDAISEEVLTQFAALKRQNFAEYLSDSKAYAEAVKKSGKRIQRADIQNAEGFKINFPARLDKKIFHDIIRARSVL